MAGNWTGQWQGKWEGRLIGPIDPSFLSGVASLQLSALGQPYGIGAIQGGSYLQLAATGSIESGVFPSYVSGAASVAFGASATLVGALLASGSASVVFDASGNVYLAVNAAGSADIGLGTSGDITGNGFATGASLISVSGGAVLSGIGRLSGQSDILITPNGEIFSPLWTGGDAGITVGITGQINGALWMSGQTDVSVQAAGLLNGIGNIAGAAWSILNAKHVDLSRYQRIYVRSIVDSVYATHDADKIVSFAGENNLSVMDSVVALRIDAKPIQIIVESIKQKRKPVEQKTVVQTKAKQQRKENKPAYSFAGVDSVYSTQEIQSCSVMHTSNHIVAQAAPQSIFIRSGKG